MAHIASQLKLATSFTSIKTRRPRKSHKHSAGFGVSRRKRFSGWGYAKRRSALYE